jgi:hypothetical protein
MEAFRRQLLEPIRESRLEPFQVYAAMKQEAAFIDWQKEMEAVHHNNYRVLFESGAMEPLMSFLARREIPRNSIRILASLTYIPDETLRAWRKDLLRDPNHRPYAQPANFSKRALTDEQEQALATKLRSAYIRKGRYCPGAMLVLLAQRELQESRSARRQRDGIADLVDIRHNDEEFLPPGEEDTNQFKGSRHWRNNFMGRHGFSLRQPHAKRRPHTEPAAVSGFLARMETIRQRYPLDHIVNMDETNWKLLNHGFVTIANRGSETVDCFFDGDPKMCLTAIAAIDAAGGKLPIWIVCRGKTTRCEKKFDDHEDLKRAIRQGELVLSHEANGWTTGQLACEYLRWLNQAYRGQPIALLWDIFAAHRCAEAKALAPELNIELEFIPAGMTGDCQPLDRRIFGNLKSRARSRFDRLWIAEEHEPSMPDSVALLLEAWKSIGQDEVLDAWEIQQQ